MNKKNVFSCLLAGAMLAGGCMTRIKVTSEPSGAMVRYRGEGRASYRWKTAPRPTPCEFRVPYGRISAYSIWPEKKSSDGQKDNIVYTESERQQITLSVFRREEKLHFKNP
ncbi:MAG: hypothetical protein GX804_02950 [Lentisphaerae bacterium]|jgi:hypothetical protein|nr:hypothetical protein [Lentisphaerota bacterium]